MREFVFSQAGTERIVVRIAPDGSGEVERQKEYCYQGVDRFHDKWEWESDQQLHVAYEGETLPAKYVRAAAKLGYVSQEIVARAEENDRLHRTIPATRKSASSGLENITLTVGDVEHALRHLGARRVRYAGIYGYTEDPNGDLIRWGGHFVPFYSVAVQDFLVAGGRLP